MTSRATPVAATSRPLTIKMMARAAFAERGIGTKASAALALFRSYCSAPPPRIPGCGTLTRLGIRVHLGMTIERAAAREYSYRWHLFLDAWINHTETRSRSRFDHGPVIYPAPHTLGQ